MTRTIRRAIDEVVSWFRPVRVDTLTAGTQLLRAGEFATDGPQFGIELFNDDTTPMAFVVRALQSELEMTYDAAVAAMLHVHNEGSVLVLVEDFARAERVANAIAGLARGNGHSLVCRAASAQQAVAADG